jgi:hypothetical protein
LAGLKLLNYDFDHIAAPLRTTLPEEDGSRNMGVAIIGEGAIEDSGGKITRRSRKQTNHYGTYATTSTSSTSTGSSSSNSSNSDCSYESENADDSLTRNLVVVETQVSLEVCTATCNTTRTTPTSNMTTATAITITVGLFSRLSPSYTTITLI